MKKLNLLFILLGMTTIGFLSSCDSTEDPGEENPTIVLSPSGDQTAIEGELVTIVATLGRNTLSKSNLKTFEVDADGTSNDTIVNFPNNTTNESYTFTVNAPLAGQQNTVTFILTDKAGKSETKTVKITGTSAVTTTDLSNASAFLWERVAGAAGTGLAQFGLKWESNTSTSAIIADDADKLVILSSSDWTSLVTVEDLMAAVDNGTGVTDYRGVSVTAANNTYDDVLATKKGNDYYLLHVTSSNVTSSSAGTTIKISGEYKN